MIRVYGIRQCDTCRKALKWLDQQAAEHRFIDLRVDPVAPARLRTWHQQLGDVLINRRSTTWRELTEAQRDLGSKTAVIALLEQHPTLIKRPVVEWGEAVTVGFGEAQWTQQLSA